MMDLYFECSCNMCVFGWNLEIKLRIGDILENITQREGISKQRRLMYLNQFVKILQTVKTMNKESASPVNLGWTVEAIFLW